MPHLYSLHRLFLAPLLFAYFLTHSSLAAPLPYLLDLRRAVDRYGSPNAIPVRSLHYLSSFHGLGVASVQADLAANPPVGTIEGMIVSMQAVGTPFPSHLMQKLSTIDRFATAIAQDEALSPRDQRQLDAAFAFRNGLLETLRVLLKKDSGATCSDAARLIRSLPLGQAASRLVAVAAVEWLARKGCPETVPVTIEGLRSDQLRWGISPRFYAHLSQFDPALFKDVMDSFLTALFCNDVSYAGSHITPCSCHRSLGLNWPVLSQFLTWYGPQSVFETVEQCRPGSPLSEWDPGIDPWKWAVLVLQGNAEDRFLIISPTDRTFRGTAVFNVRPPYFDALEQANHPAIQMTPGKFITIECVTDEALRVFETSSYLGWPYRHRSSSVTSGAIQTPMDLDEKIDYAAWFGGRPATISDVGWLNQTYGLEQSDSCFYLVIERLDLARTRAPHSGEGPR